MLKPNKKITRILTYSELAKVRLSSAVTLSALTGYIMSSGSADGRLLFTGGGIFLLACGAASLNQVSERYQDGLMARTSHRPIPANRISVKEAVIFLIIMLVSGSILLSFCGPGPMLLGLLCVFLYNIIYTQLKLITSLAIIPGAITGAIPPIIGFTAAGGTVSDQRILIFSGFMFLWQLPHFWLLLIRYNEDFVKAGIKTIANFVKRKNIPLLVFSWVLLTSVYIVLFFGFSDVYGNYFSKIVLIANPVFIIYFYRQLFSSKKPEYLSGAFFALNAFSILLMLSLMADSLIKLS